MRLESCADADRRPSFVQHLRRQPHLQKLGILGDDTVEVAEEMMPTLCEMAANFGVQVLRDDVES